jgi:crotonobetainyl-CoA:carnitine CoA-transferase CaiB-like acyl-CoA transferase
VAAPLGGLTPVALLIRRERTGRGRQASIAQAEVMLAQISREIGLAMEGKQADARSAVYPCRGDDDWIGISQRNGAEAAAIASVCGARRLKNGQHRWRR